MTPLQEQLAEERRVERRYQRLASKRDTASLPSSVRRRVDTLRVPLLTDHVVAQIRADAVEVARARGGVVRGDGVIYNDFVPEAVLRRTIRGRARDGCYRNWIRNRVEEAKRDQHLERLRSAGATNPRFLNVPTERWEAACDLGLGTASFLDALPDEVAFAIASLVSRACIEDDDENLELDLEPVRALVLGAGPSTLALAVDSLEARNVAIVEAEAFTAPNEPLCQETRLAWLDDFSSLGSYNAVVLHPPSPALGVAAQHRNPYIEGLSLDANPRSGRLSDPGRLGPKKWCMLMRHIVVNAIEALVNDGLLVLYMPTGTRVTWELATGVRLHGCAYKDEPRLVEWLVSTLQDAKVRILRDIEVVEANPVPQPFVGLERCRHRLLVARKKAS